MDYLAVGALATVSTASAAIAQALIALRNSKSLSSIDDSALALLESLRCSLTNLREMGQYLKEAKQFHDVLNRTVPHWGYLRSPYESALFDARFHKDRYDIGSVCRRWNEFQPDFLELRNFLFLEMNVYDSGISFDEATKRFEGATWAIELLHSHSRIEAMVKKRESGGDVDKNVFADEVNAFVAKLKQQMSLANRSIRKQASDISDGFLLIAQELDSVKFERD